MLCGYVQYNYLLQIFNAGYKNLDAIDGSSGMLQVAKGRNIYNRVICDYVGKNKLDIENGMSYIILFQLGMFWHLKLKTLKQMFKNKNLDKFTRAAFHQNSISTTSDTHPHITDT